MMVAGYPIIKSIAKSKITTDVLCGDCIEVMARLPAASVDMVLADLPYGATACDWDSIIPLDQLWAQYWRVTKPSAAIVLFSSQPFTTALISSQIGKFRYEWIWNKNLPTGFATAKTQPMKSHENILVFGVGKLCYNPQPTETKIKDRALGGSNGLRAKAKSGGVYGGLQTKQTEIMLKSKVSPRTVLDIPCVPRATGTFHPTQKPVELLRYLIRTYSNQDETVLDNTMGSGSTGVAAVLEGRKFIGIEKDAVYFNTAQQRMAQECPLMAAE